MRSFLSHLASVFVARAGDLSDLCFVFPGRRAGLFFRQSLSEQIKSPVLSPRIITLSEMFTELAASMPEHLRKADSIDLLFILYDIYSQINHKAEPFEQFVYWGRMIISDFNEADTHLADARRLFSIVKESKAIDYTFSTDVFADPSHASDESQLRRRNIEFWNSIYPLYEQFRGSLQNEHIAYEGMLQRSVIEYLRENDTTVDKYGKVVFVGFNALTPVEEELFIKFRDAGNADFYFDYSAEVLQDPQNNASLFFKRNTSLFPSKYDLAMPLRKLSEVKINHISVMTDVGQTLAVSSLLEQLFPAAVQPEEERLRQTAVVLADENMLLPMLYAIPENISSVNVTMGYPLRQTQIASLVDSFFALHTHLRNSDTCQYYYKYVLGILSNPVLRMIDENQIREVLSNLVKENRLFVEPSYFDGQQNLTTIFAPVANASDALQRLRVILEKIIALNANQLSDYAYHYLTIVNRMERLWQSHSALTNNLPIEVLRDMLKQLVSLFSVPFEGEPLSGLQVMGVLETRALDFGNLIITSVNDEVFPHKSVRLSFISEQLRAAFGLPTMERAEAVTAYNFYRMLSYAENVWLISNVNNSDNKSGELSRYILQLNFQYDIEMTEAVVKDTVYCKETQDLSLAKTPYIMQHLNDYLSVEKEHGLSPSALADYVKCPFKFCMTHVLRYREPVQMSTLAAPNLFGTIIHAVMEKLYEPFIEKTVTAEDLQRMISDRTMLRDTITDRYDYYMYSGRHTANTAAMSGVDVLTVDVLFKYVVNVLEYDFTQAPFVYRASEMKIKQSFEFDEGKYVLLSGSIDRIDSREGITRVIDYKTGNYLLNGKVNLDFNDVKQLFTNKDMAYLLQTMYYCLLLDPQKYDRQIAPHIYYLRLMADKNNMRSAVSSNGSFDFESVKKDFEEELKTIIKEMLDSGTPFVRKFDIKNQKSKCNYCPFLCICQSIRSTTPTEETA